MSEWVFKLPGATLSSNKILRREQLDTYFPSGLIPFERELDDAWEVIAFTPKDPAYFVDPRIHEVLWDWHEQVSIEEIGNYRSFYKNCMISFFDSWSLYYWSLLAAYLREKNEKRSFFLLHIDDHKDLGSPLFFIEDDDYFSMLNHEKISFSNPSSIRDAVLSKSIGIDSFIVPLLSSHEVQYISHLKYSHTSKKKTVGLEIKKELDSILSFGKNRLKVHFSTQPSTISYSISNTIETIMPTIPEDSILLLHIDCDGFFNRYNLDENWHKSSLGKEKTLDEVKRMILNLSEALKSLPNQIFINIALSPGFFPSEYWKETCNTIIELFEGMDVIKEDLFSQFILQNYPEELRYDPSKN